MKQVRVKYQDGTLRLVEAPPPALQPGGVLVATAASLISLGTEGQQVRQAEKNLIGQARERPDQVRQVIDSFRRTGFTATYRQVMTKLGTPLPLGYSAAGVVRAVGAGVEEFRVGDRVACAGGGHANHAELIYVPRTLCVPIPAGVSYEEAACATVGSVALHGARQIEPTLGEWVAVIGLGLVGQLAVQILRAHGCRVIGIDTDPEKVRLAADLGAEAALTRNDPTLEGTVRQRTAGRGWDAALITASSRTNDPVELAARLMRDRGRVIALGRVKLDLPRNAFYDKEIDLRVSRSYGPGRYDRAYEEQGQDYPIGYVRWTVQRNLEAFLALVAAGQVRLGPIITHRFALDDAEEAYDLLTAAPTAENGSGSAPLGVVFQYDLEKPQPTRVSIAKAASRPAPDATVGVGFIGAGSFARQLLLPPLAKMPRIRLVGVAAATGLSGGQTAEQFDFAYSTGDYRDILADPEVQVVFVATRHNLHAAIAAEALRAGKTVFVEKPLALSWGELQAVVEAQRETGGRLMVGFNRRFAPHARAVRDHFADRAEPLSLVVRVNAGFLPKDHWTQDAVTGGGRINGEACHFVDLLHYLVGSRPVEVEARLLSDSGRYNGDNLVATLVFADGSIGTLIYVAHGDRSLPKEWIEVTGAGRAASINDFREATLHGGGRSRRIRGSGQDKGHEAEVTAFVTRAWEGQPPPVAFDEAVFSTLATLAIVESAATGQRVAIGVDVPVEKDR